MTMQIDWLRGCATALVTPFKSNGAVDVETMRVLVERQIAGGVKILIPCGTTGESATMTEDEDQLVIKTTLDVARQHRDVYVIAGTGSNSTAATIEYSLKAREIGADGALIVAPYYNKPTQEGLYAHYKTIAEALEDFPIVMYNVPGRTSSNIAAATQLRLARDFENIVATKEASGNLSQIMEILRTRPEGFRVLSGDDAVTLALIALGADGLVSVVSNEVPRLTSQMVNAALDGDFDAARALHYRLLPLMEMNFIETSPGPVKAVMAMLNLLEENLRLPLVPVTEQTRARLRACIEELGILKETAHVAS
jgi:4-hydroxy-tetrahydrodipicolinate synthase